MASHCIDVICLDCGREWCARGCGNFLEAKPNQETITHYLKRKQEWSDKFNNGNFYLGVRCTSLFCQCGKENVYIL